MIGGSDVAGILGMSEYKTNTPYAWWRRHFGLDAPIDETMKMKAGKALEGDLTAWYENFMGVKLQPSDLVRDKEYDWLGGNPDRVSVDGKRVVELKMVGFRVAMKLGEPGTDEVITDHLLQARTYEGLMRQQGAPVEAVDWVYWNWDWPEPRIYTAEADPEMYFVIRARLKGFKEQFIDTQTPPPVDGSEAAAQHIKELFPHHAEGKVIVADEKADLLCHRLYEITAQSWDIEDEEKAIKQAIQMYMGDSEELHAQVGKFAWKNNKDSEKVDWQAVCRSLAQGLERPGGSSADQILAQHAKRFTTIVPGPRVFRTPFRRGK